MRLITGILIFILSCQVSFAMQCPSIKALKHRQFHGFSAYDSDDGKKLSKKRLAKFINKVDQFILAEWQDTLDHYGAIHCYYRDKEGSEMEAYLTRNNLKPHNAKHWYKVSGSMHCAAGMLQCQFKHNKSTKHFAKR